VTVTFEFDPEKSAANQAKHGIDFVEAQRLWGHPRRLVTPTDFSDEPRELVTGLIDDVFWTAVVTYRDDVIRLISVKRARREEVERYGSQESHLGG
jgi:uncharacterized protein